MKWFRIILALFLIVGMLLCVSSIAYADPGDDPPPDPPSGDPPADPPGLDVGITVVGDNSNVGVDVIGQNSEVTVNTTGTEVWINGQNLNEPTAVYNNSYSGASNMGVIRVIKDVMSPWMEETWARLNLTMDGLAKVILMAQAHDSELDTQISTVDTHENRLTTLESETASLGGRVDALEAQDAAIEAQITARVNYVMDYYNRILIIIIAVFSVVVIGLGVGLYLTRRRTHIVG